MAICRLEVTGRKLPLALSLAGNVNAIVPLVIGNETPFVTNVRAALIVTNVVGVFVKLPLGEVPLDVPTKVILLFA